MPGKQQLSGSAKRKLKEQREALAVCKKVPKITDWDSKVNVNQQPFEAEHATDVDLEVKDAEDFNRISEEETLQISKLQQQSDLSVGLGDGDEIHLERPQGKTSYIRKLHKVFVDVLS